MFRIARVLEMAWVAVFLTLSLSSASFGRPSWLLTAALSLCATAVVVGLEMRKPSYHGVGWSFVNPGLRAWWDSAPRG